MGRWSLVAVTVLGCIACDALDLELHPPRTPRDAGALVDAPPVPDDAGASACPVACLGGRRCEGGACVPHWLPILATEGINDAPRVGHFVVWTGREVILWGGRAPEDPGRTFGDGVRFDPVRGELRAMSRVDAPSARFQDGVTAVWDGREMLVLGGRDALGLVRDGASYSPELDRWRALSSALPPRAPLTALYTGHDVLVLGSARDGLEGLRFLPGTDVFASTLIRGPSSMRLGHSALWTGAEVVVWGGADELGAVRADGYRYVPSRRRWRAIRDAGAMNARRGHSAVWSSSEMLVFGGVDRAGRSLAAPVSYVPAVDAWRALSSVDAPSPREGQVAVWTGDAMLIWGGRDASGTRVDGASYDPWDDAWTALPPLPAEYAGRAGAAGIWTGSELVVLAGDADRDSLSPFGWRYQP